MAANKFVMDDLKQKEVSSFHQQMLDKCKLLLRMSRDHMVKYYGKWDSYNDTYRGIRQRDDKDIKARERREPEKMVVPLTYAQVQTFAAFCFLLFTQNPTFFEINGSGIEDWKASKIAEAVLQRDLLYNNYYSKLYQWLLDIGRFGIGIFKHYWVRETQRSTSMTQPEQQAAVDMVSQGSVASTFAGAPMPEAAPTGQVNSTTTTKTKYLGNRIVNISPYRWFPDPRVPISRFQEGEFCCSEEDVSRIWLKQMEVDGMFYGTEFIPRMPTEEWQRRKETTRTNLIALDATGAGQVGESPKDGVVMSEIQINVVPKEWKIDNEPIGPEDYPVKYVVVIGNDSRIIKCEPLGYEHNEFTYSATEMSPDQHQFLNAGFAETIDQLQDTVTWLINAKITSTRKTIQNFLVVDPEGVEMKDLADRNPVIRLKKGMARSGVDRWIKQLTITDVTQNHLKEADILQGLIELVTGINENALGQYSSGRRSATQTQAVNQGGSSRLRMIAHVIYSSCLDPMARNLLSNLRDGLDEPQLVRVMGLQTIQPVSPYAVNSGNFAQFLTVDKSDLIGNYDFDLMDATLPSDKQRLAGIYQEILQECIQNPQGMALFGIDPRALFQEILELNGVKNPERFLLQAQQQQALLQASHLMQQDPQQVMQAAAGPAAMAASSAQQQNQSGQQQVAPQGAPTGAPIIPNGADTGQLTVSTPRQFNPADLISR
jgi:hypothetical protein